MLLINIQRLKNKAKLKYHKSLIKDIKKKLPKYNISGNTILVKKIKLIFRNILQKKLKNWKLK